MKGIARGFLPSRPNRVLVLGSGPLQIGQAGEFDYSGSQALKALQQEGVFTVLINPNLATVQSGEDLADRVYSLPLTPHFVEQVILQEQVDAILLGFGGQTALNCGLALEAQGILERHRVRVLGTPLSTIRITEDRQLFIDSLAAIGVQCARSRAVTHPEDALAAARQLGLPVILRAGFALGGQGSAMVREEAALAPAVERAFQSATQVLVEESLEGWKELEYEVVRDAEDNCVVVCTLENVDPLGIHTGESMVVAPCQTLSDHDHQLLRNLALRTIRHLGVVGECNIQFALDPRSDAYRVIEVNARLSRSSALASKATGYPLAFVAAKIALGYALPQIANAVTRSTTAFFEPALDYVVCKIPRWDFDKFEGARPQLGPEMKSVGEVMAIGRSFPEALQKALRMLEIGVDGLDPEAYPFPDPAAVEEALVRPTPRRPFALARALRDGMGVARLAELTGIDPFFLHEMQRVVQLHSSLRRGELEALSAGRMRELKRAGFSDRGLGRALGAEEAVVRQRRLALGVVPGLAQIDTLAAEFPAQTHYLYLSYAAEGNDVVPLGPAARRVLVLGSGCYRIGSSVEFDWCAVQAVAAARELGLQTVLLNCNPETVSTDYDVCDNLVFDEISLETVLALQQALPFQGVIVSMGGQTPNNLALKLERAGVPVLGTTPEAIDSAENRSKFGALCDSLGIDQPRWTEVRSLEDLPRTVENLGGFPVLVRPSYVLSGAAMRVAHSDAELRDYLARATELSPEHPVVVSRFERHAREIEFDAVADQGEIVHWAICEHLEYAGVHSGDATLVLPPHGLYLDTVNRVRRIAARLAQALRVTGPFNLQLLSRHHEVKVIEANVRASRSFPFVSKVLGTNFIREATRRILGGPPGTEPGANPLELDFYAVKAPMFSFRRLAGVDPVLRVEMSSTGEGTGFGWTAEEALLKAMLSTGFRLPTRGVLLSLGPVGDKYRFTEEARELVRQGLRLYATLGTAEILHAEGLPVVAVDKEGQDSRLKDATALLRSGAVDLVINIPRDYGEAGRPDGFRIRRAAIDLDIPLLTDLRLARKVVWALGRCPPQALEARAWTDYRGRRPR